MDQFRHLTLEEFRAILEASPEARTYRRELLVNLDWAQIESYANPVTCFIHLEKTGGTTIHDILTPHFEPEKISPPHLSILHHFSMADLSEFELVSGHFDFFSTMLIPSTRLRRISIFRDPVDRLISFYRYTRAHPDSSRDANEFVSLAHALTPSEFFSHELVLRSPRTNNAYLRAFGISGYTDVPTSESDADVASAIELASQRIRGLDALGLTERMPESVYLICRALGLQQPCVIRRMNDSENLASEMAGFAPAEQVEITPDLLDSMLPLVRHDRELYRIAQAEFDRRLAAGT
jgi:hypothetical protein